MQQFKIYYRFRGDFFQREIWVRSKKRPSEQSVKRKIKERENVDRLPYGTEIVEICNEREYEEKRQEQIEILADSTQQDLFRTR